MGGKEPYLIIQMDDKEERDKEINKNINKKYYENFMNFLKNRCNYEVKDELFSNCTHTEKEDGECLSCGYNLCWGVKNTFTQTSIKIVITSIKSIPLWHKNVRIAVSSLNPLKNVNTAAKKVYGLFRFLLLCRLWISFCGW